MDGESDDFVSAVSVQHTREAFPHGRFDTTVLALLTTPETPPTLAVARPVLNQWQLPDFIRPRFHRGACTSKECFVLKRGVFPIAAAIVSLTAGPAFAQGQQAGVLTGRVVSADKLPLPGVTITVSSSAQQGQRSTVTDVNGVYSLPGLPPGTYTVRLEMDGMSSVERRAHVPLGAAVTLDQQMTLAAVRETVDVRGNTPAPVTSPAGAVNVRSNAINLLPAGRTPFLVAELTPGLSDNTPNGTQVTMSGGFAYDNVFLMNGVDVNDNVLGQPNNLFIEDAIEEVQVLTSGISAEYGRFSGGVVNVITKSGGNRFTGAFRLNLTNPAWSSETPFEKSRGVSRASKPSPTYEATTGGPILRDRLWFFGGARIERTTTQTSFAQTGVPYTSSNENSRYEGKLTGTFAPGHTLQGSFIDNRTNLRQPAIGAASIDPATFTTPSTPNRLFAATWRGSVGSRTFATAQYSQKNWELENAGGSSAAIVDSPFLTRGVPGVPANLNYNGPYWDSTDPEQRNNRQLTGSVTHMLSSRGAGTHELKGGFEYLVSTRVGGNSQSASGYVFSTDYLLNGTAPAFDANGRLIPRFVPGVSRLATWMPLRGSSIDVKTTSLFVADHWTVGSRLTLDLGARYETASSDATGDISAAAGSSIVPRLAAAYALTPDGRTVLQGTYGHYAGKYNDVQFSRNSNVGNADRITGTYMGPAGQGRDFAPGFDPANYQTFTGTFPTANVFFADDLSSPLTREFSFALARDFGHAGWGRVSYVNRHAGQFVEDFITLDGGRTTIARNGIDLGAFDNAVYRNTDLPKRDYQALIIQSSFVVRPSLTLNGDWTLQIENHGNFEGEAASNPAIPSLIGDYPEIHVAARNFPDGRLDDFQRHKVRVWAAWGLELGAFGRLDVAPLYRFNSGRTYSLVAAGVPLSAEQIARNPGYARLPTSQSVFFGARGSGTFEGAHLVDLGMTYAVPAWQSIRPWVRFEALNLFDNDTLVAWSTSITADMTGPKDANGLPLNYVKSASFGAPTGTASYPRPRPGMDGGRTFLMSAGVRF